MGLSQLTKQRIPSVAEQSLDFWFENKTIKPSDGVMSQMIMLKVKVFKNMSNGLEREMNEWILKENIKKIQIISQSSNGSCNDMAIVVVLYEEQVLPTTSIMK